MNFRTLFLLVGLSVAGKLSAQSKTLDSLWGAFHNEKFSDSLRINAIHNISIRLAHANPDSGLSACKVYMDYLDKRHLTRSYAGAYNALGTCYLNKGNLDSALSNYEKSLYYRRQDQDKRGEASALNNIGIVYYQRADYTRCLDYYYQSLRIKDSLGDKTGVASSYSNIGMINEVEGNLDKAMINYKRSLHLRDSLHDNRGLGDSYLKMGGIYLSWKKYDSAIHCVRLGVYHCELAGDMRTRSTGLSNLGNIYSISGPSDSAEFYYRLALKSHQNVGNEEGIATVHADMGNFFIRLKRYNSAINSCDSSNLISKALGFPNLQLESCACLSKAYDATGQPAKALYYYKLADSLRDTLNNVEKAKELNRKSLEFDFKMSKLTDSLRAVRDNELKDLQRDEEVREQRIYAVAGASGFLLMIVLAVILYRGSRQKQQLNEQLNRKNIQVEEKQKAILDSIIYAKRLQEAILPSLDTVKTHLPGSFVLYKPKDIVAGDFYWLEHVGGTTFVAAADCTGHGVPGAMVSVVCSAALNRCVLEFGITDPGKILDRTRELVLETFSKSDADVKDGMDISLIALTEKEILWAGANNPLWVFEEGKLTAYKADKQPIGKTDNPRPFTTITLQRRAGSRIYLLTDGFADQFGGPQGKKFKYKQLEQILADNYKSSMDEQREILDNAFVRWQGSLEQVDDVCIIGIEIS